MIQTPMFINIVFFIYFSISHFILFLVSFNLVLEYPITNLFCISSSAFSFLKKYTLLKSLALVILHHNHSLLTRYDFCHSCIVMFPPIDVPCLLGPPDRETKKNEKQTTLFQNSFCRSPKFKDLWCFVFFLETQDSQTSGKLYSFVFMNTQSIWSYLKCLYLWQNFQKNICKSMENRTLRDTRSVNLLLFVDLFAGLDIMINRCS